MKLLEEQSATKRRFQAVYSVFVSVFGYKKKNRCYINRQAHTWRKILKKVIEKEKKKQAPFPQKKQEMLLCLMEKEKRKGKGGKDT